LGEIDSTAGFFEYAGMGFGGVLAVGRRPDKVVTKGIAAGGNVLTNLASKELTGTIVNVTKTALESKVTRSYTWFSASCVNRSAANQVAQRTFQIAEGGVAKQGILNGKSIWTPGKQGNSVRNAFLHWKDHGHEFTGIQNSKQYVEQAHGLFRGSSVLRRVRSVDGVHLRYDPLTNTFGSFTADGVPKTMFKPDMTKLQHSKYSSPLEYFYGQ